MTMHFGTVEDNFIVPLTLFQEENDNGGVAKLQLPDHQSRYYTAIDFMPDCQLQKHHRGYLL